VQNGPLGDRVTRDVLRECGAQRCVGTARQFVLQLRLAVFR